MFHHIALFRLKPGITLDKIRQAREELSALVETLPGVLHFAVTDNLATHNHGFTLTLFSLFESQQACLIFQRHPGYKRVWKDLLQPVIEEQVVAEGEVE